MQFSEAYDPFRAFGQSTQLMRRAPAALLVGGALLVLLDGGGGGGSQVELGGGGLEGVIVAALIFGACVVGLAVFAFTSLLRVGFTRSVRRAAQEGTDDIADLFRGTDRWLAMVLTRLLQGVILVAVSIPGLVVAGLLALIASGIGGDDLAAGVAVLAGIFYLPFIVYVLLGFSLAKYAVALEGCDPIAALERSWRLVDGHRVQLFLYCVAMAIATLLGLVLCCVGVFLTGALAEVAAVESYLRLTTDDSDQAGWWLSSQSSPSSPGTAGAPPATGSGPYPPAAPPSNPDAPPPVA